MFKKFAFGLAASLTLLAGCNHQASSEKGQDPGNAVTASIAKDVGKSQVSSFKPHQLDHPILGFYVPEFSYSVRSGLKGKRSANGVVYTTSLEFWGVSLKQADGSVHKKMEQLGYTAAKAKSDENSISTTYSAPERSDVLVNTTLKGGRTMHAPEAVGTIFFRWTESGEKQG